MPAQEFTTIGSKGVIGLMFQEMEAAKAASWVSQIANEFSSTQATETYAGVGTVPQLREWLGGKQAKSFTKQSLTISNKDWESTIRLNVKDLRRDKTGFLQAKAAELAQRAMMHDASRLSTLIENGAGTTQGTCYDAKALFADDHSVGDSGTIDNLIDADISTFACNVHGTTTIPSVEEMIQSILSGVTTLQTFKDDAGEPINESAQSFVVMVPTGLAVAARSAVGQTSVANGQTNPLGVQGLNFTVSVNPRLTWTDKFAVFRADNPFKSFIVQLEQAMQIKALAEGSDFEFTENAHLYSVEKSGNVGYCRFDQCVQVTLV